MSEIKRTLQGWPPNLSEEAVVGIAKSQLQKAGLYALYNAVGASVFPYSAVTACTQSYAIRPLETLVVILQISRRGLGPTRSGFALRIEMSALEVANLTSEQLEAALADAIYERLINLRIAMPSGAEHSKPTIPPGTHAPFPPALVAGEEVLAQAPTVTGRLLAPPRPPRGSAEKPHATRPVRDISPGAFISQDTSELELRLLSASPNVLNWHKELEKWANDFAYYQPHPLRGSRFSADHENQANSPRSLEEHHSYAREYLADWSRVHSDEPARSERARALRSETKNLLFAEAYGGRGTPRPAGQILKERILGGRLGIKIRTLEEAEEARALLGGIPWAPPDSSLEARKSFIESDVAYRGYSSVWCPHGVGHAALLHPSGVWALCCHLEDLRAEVGGPTSAAKPEPEPNHFASLEHCAICQDGARAPGPTARPGLTHCPICGRQVPRQEDSMHQPVAHPNLTRPRPGCSHYNGYVLRPMDTTQPDRAILTCADPKCHAQHVYLGSLAMQRTSLETAQAIRPHPAPGLKLHEQTLIQANQKHLEGQHVLGPDGLLAKLFGALVQLRLRQVPPAARLATLREADLATRSTTLLLHFWAPGWEG